MSSLHCHDEEFGFQLWTWGFWFKVMFSTTLKLDHDLLIVQVEVIVELVVNHWKSQITGNILTRLNQFQTSTFGSGERQQPSASLKCLDHSAIGAAPWLARFPSTCEETLARPEYKYLRHFCSLRIYSNIEDKLCALVQQLLPNIDSTLGEVGRHPRGVH